MGMFALAIMTARRACCLNGTWSQLLIRMAVRESPLVGESCLLAAPSLAAEFCVSGSRCRPVRAKPGDAVQRSYRRLH